MKFWVIPADNNKSHNSNYIRKLGTWFLRKVPESDEVLTRKSLLDVSTRDMDKAILINEAAFIVNQ